ncbi:MAG: helix-turn-helix domain-containing protein, partial [Kineosporiaceae bacterium]
PPTSSPSRWPQRTRSPPAGPARSGPPNWPPNGPATKPTAPNARSWPANRRTGWSPAAWNHGGRPGLIDLTGAETALTAQRAAQTPLPPPAELAAAVADMHTLWAAPSTSDKDRKRILRALLGDVTLRPGDTPRELRVGLRWKSGAATEVTVQRMSAVTEWRRASPETVALARELGPRMSNPELADALNAAGQHTGAGHPFDAKAAANLRHAHRIASPATLSDGELTPRAVAARLKISTSTVHDWITSGVLPARRARGGHWAISFTPDIQADCQARLAVSGHIHRDADDQDAQPGEISIAATAVRLGVKPDVVYYWAQRGYLPTRRGKSGRRWVSLTPDLEQRCRQRIADSYKLPDQVKSQARPQITSRTTQPAERTAV